MRFHGFSMAFPMAVAIALTGCAKSTENVAGNNAAQPGAVETIEDVDTLGNHAPEAARLPTDDWVGRWTGPEGLFLDIQPSPDGKPGHYAIANQDTLDRKGDYTGIAEGATIRFVRDGRDLAIRPGKGSETGFKYLADKNECLIVIPDREGYCR
ncbi:hypothetical protein [Sphingobium cloacae]|uniref:Lipoprotein n=1 Tax=Sphingobium cloacae TaxID=120107 RepID=A0A1E1F5Z1_9SPHN|nr:hypothetical protein [Sphingobium cloacae]BAV65934.1 hypothetical protein SCLO_1028940 [Sphingobium cloacae]